MATSLGEPATGSPPRAPERFWNLPNSITMLRMMAVPVLLVFPWFHESASASRAVAWVFIVAAVTDILDGWLARRGQQVTRIGKLLDPLADKLLVATALVVLIAIERIPLWGVPLAVVIIGRELAVTGLRGIASAGGQVLAADWRGKAKALCQNVALGALLFPDPTIGLPVHAIGMGFLGLATVITLWSGYVYFAAYFAPEAGGDSGVPES